MREIRSYAFSFDDLRGDRIEIGADSDAEILCVKMVNGMVCVYAIVDASLKSGSGFPRYFGAPVPTKTLHVIRTGSYVSNHSKYIGTVFDSEIRACHIFEERR